MFNHDQGCVHDQKVEHGIRANNQVLQIVLSTPQLTELDIFNSFLFSLKYYYLFNILDIQFSDL